MAKGGRISLKKGRKIGVSWVIPSRHHGGFNSHALNDLDDGWGSPILGHLHTIVMINWAVFKTQNVMTLYCWVNRDLQNGWWRSATYWIVWLQSSTTNQGFVSHCSSEQYVVTSSYQQSTSTEAPLTTSLKNSSVNALQEFAKDGTKGPGVFPRQPQTPQPTLTIWGFSNPLLGAPQWGYPQEPRVNHDLLSFWFITVRNQSPAIGNHPSSDWKAVTKVRWAWKIPSQKPTKNTCFMHHPWPIGWWKVASWNLSLVYMWASRKMMSIMVYLPTWICRFSEFRTVITRPNKGCFFK